MDLIWESMIPLNWGKQAVCTRTAALIREHGATLRFSLWSIFIPVPYTKALNLRAAGQAMPAEVSVKCVVVLVAQ